MVYTYLIFCFSLVFFDDLGEDNIALIVLIILGRSLLERELTAHFLTLILHHAVKVVKGGEPW